ncbi:MAG: hypothetical protein ACXWPM_11015 [Bdellovibrionota bacterium]
MKRFGTLIMIALWAPAAWAYVPPSQFIIKTLIGKHAAVKGVKIHSTVSAMEGDRATEVRFKETTVYSPETGVLASWATDEADHKLYFFERKVGAFTPIDELLFGNDLSAATRMLRARHIPIKTEEELLALPNEDERRAAEEETFMRWKATFAWIIGAPKSASNPQLWIEKDTFLPLRFIYDRPVDDSTREVQFEAFRFYHEFPFPRATLVLKGGSALLRDDLVDVAVNPEPAQMKVAREPTGYTDAGNAAPGPVRDLIREYYETIR